MSMPNGNTAPGRFASRAHIEETGRIMSIVVTGSIAIDDVVTAHRKVKSVPGGSALYFAAAASQFAHVRVIAVVGDDFPRGELEFLVERGVDISGIHTVRGGKTFRWAGEYELDMNKRTTTALELNVFKDFDPVLSGDSRKAPYVFLGNIHPELQLRVLDQVDSPLFTAADTIECYLEDKPGLFREVLRRIDLLFINDAEALLFTGEHNVIAAARSLLDCGPEYVIIKKGEHGSLLMSREALFVVPAFPVEQVVDPTGAGDSYAGGVMGFIASEGDHGWETIRKAVVHGGVVASFLVEGFSLDTLKNLTRERIEERVEAFRGMTAY